MIDRFVLTHNVEGTPCKRRVTSTVSSDSTGCRRPRAYDSIFIMFWYDTRATASESPHDAALSCSTTKCSRPARAAFANTGLKSTCPTPMGVNAMLLTRAFGPSDGFTVFKPKKSLMCHNSKRSNLGNLVESGRTGQNLVEPRFSDYCVEPPKVPGGVFVAFRAVLTDVLV
jgi:hypothetical protein